MLLVIILDGVHFLDKNLYWVMCDYFIWGNTKLNKKQQVL